MDQKTYHSILDQAIQAEIEANQFSQDVAARMKNASLKEMFLDFAAQELGHRRILEGFKNNATAAISFARVQDFHVAETVQEPTLSLDLKPADAIALAMKKEETAMRHYAQLAEACKDMQQRRLFEELAAMEREHKARMERAFVDIGYPEVW